MSSGGDTYRQILVAANDAEVGKMQTASSALDEASDQEQRQTRTRRACRTSLIAAGAVLGMLVGMQCYQARTRPERRPGSPGTGFTPKWVHSISREYATEAKTFRQASMPRNPRTVTLAGFQMKYLNGRYTERFGIDYVIANKPTFWDATGKFVLYFCGYSTQWKIGLLENFDNIKNGICDYTAYAPVKVSVLDFNKPRGWWEWRDGRDQEAPQAGVQVLSTTEGLSTSESSSSDIFDIQPTCEGPPYSPPDYMATYERTLSPRKAMKREVFYKQGACQDIWAVTVASLVERLLCITGSGQWAGPRAMLSAAYITSCASTAWIDGKDGCNSGKALEALWWIGENGVPTGGDELDRMTCVPFFQASETSNLSEAPACPSMCTNERYPRTMLQDLFKPEGLKFSYETTALESALHELKRTPILAIIPLFEDFYNHTSGVYRHTWGKRLGNHLLVCHGHSAEYFQCMNSGGTSRGHQGSVRIGLDVPLAFVIPGEISSSPSLPYPLPPLADVQLGGFQDANISGKYEYWAHPAGAIGGHKTFWKGDAYVLFWCVSEQAWAVHQLVGATYDSPQQWQVGLRALKSKLAANCSWSVKGPKLEQFKPIFSSPTLGWTEMRMGQPVVLATAGIQGQVQDASAGTLSR
eukprot:TRINITY_DN109153_c0_g1_i1.p1 TRINITY_DN109153_c0_g1~~TRINITY_DN109153_c0_g1_i1.p1  ORF type:complete len:640 (+),score=75.87 TRINITY_DN109153_c0_g1_i1:108-2027(+)